MAHSLHDLLLNDRGFAFNPTSGETFQLSSTALRIVRLLQQEDSHDVILAKILEEYDVEPRTASRDLEDFLQAAKQAGWIAS